MLYANVAQSKDAAKTAGTVKINGHPVCTKASVFSKSTGDEAGRKGGVLSGTTQGQAEFLTASPNVLIEGEPAVRAHDLMVSNNQNTQPAPLMQPSGTPPQALLADEPEDADPNDPPNAYAVEVAGGELPLVKGQLAGLEPEE
ncbi:hypothetical protein CAI21_22205 [Alkalilimnicola ehrlichii]|nr:hypothetical protein CAI21_22205 [Alkalilimnicola ehrlichii]